MTRLEQVTNVCMAVVSLAIAADVGSRMWNGRSVAATARSPQAPPVYKVGELIGDIPNLKRAEDRPSLLLVVRSTCAYCTKSLPFYQRLTADVRSTGSQVQLNGVCTEPAEACADYLAAAGVAVDQLTGVPPGLLKVVGTPTLVLVGIDGRVKQVWSGMLTSEQERNVLQIVTGRTD